MSFSDFGLPPELLQSVEEAGFTAPTAIQSAAMPYALEGRDLLAAAETGSGKTAAFLLPILARLMPRERGTTRALVLAPTRELAAQIDEQFGIFAYHTNVSGAPVFGGVPMGPQERAFESRVDVVIATPGRLLDHLRFPYATLDDVEILVLDEADRMLDMGFMPDIRRILRLLPKRKQTLLFSATLPPEIVRLVDEFLVDPARINVDRKPQAAGGIRHTVFPVAADMKAALLVKLLERPELDRALVFTRTKERAERVASYLHRYGCPVGLIHGDRPQRERTEAMTAFRQGRHRVLVATDVAARGIDVFELSHVVNFDVPGQPEDYIHRAGRTARASATGDAFTFVSPSEEQDLRAIERTLRMELPREVLPEFAPAGGGSPAPAGPPRRGSKRGRTTAPGDAPASPRGRRPRRDGSRRARKETVPVS